ncbi:hypothetical protein T484DRAFT_1763486 [Baffinella frigidus]|nr:hypothetical protein T484DRAFT_1763486 [Cryptophyta sp. CCMP2293]
MAVCVGPTVVGSVHTLPTLLENLFKHGFLYTVCRDPEDWYLNGPTGLWVGLFIFSKIPELLDTAFLVMQQKRKRVLAPSPSGWFADYS